jgi:hypothetical protein
MLEQHPKGGKALPGHVWVDTPGNVLHVQATRPEPSGPKSSFSESKGRSPVPNPSKESASTG